MRISGIASGLDTEQMVKDLMRAESVRMNKFLRQEQTLKWRQDTYFTMNRTMSNFILNTRKSFGLNSISYNGTIASNASNSFTWVKQAVSSNEGAVKATARANAMNGSYDVEVIELASSATLSSQNLTKSNFTDEDDIAEIPVLSSDFKFMADGEITIQVTDENNNTLTTKISIKKDQDISTFITSINNAVDTDTGKSLGVRAIFDKGLGQFILSTRETGEKTISISDVGGSDTAKKMFGLYSGETEATKKGTNAEIKFNGTTITKSTNNFTVFGIDLNIKAKTEAVTINVNTNTDGIYDKIKSFVDEYNQMLDVINGKLGEKQYRDFFPLTKDEKEAMTEKEIELWEEKAKSGIIRNDEALSRALQSIRSQLYEKVEGVTGSYGSLLELGITTGNYREGGKLVINEERLKDAINSDPDGVMNLFFKAPDISSTGKARTEQSGIVQRMYDGVIAGMKEVISRSGTGADESLLRSVQGNILVDFSTKLGSKSLIDKDIQSINSRIAQEQSILNRREERYYKQFTAMEKALSQMNQQSAWLMAQLGLGQ